MSDIEEKIRRDIHWALSGLSPRAAQRILEEVAAEYEADAVIAEMEEETRRNLRVVKSSDLSIIQEREV